MSDFSQFPPTPVLPDDPTLPAAPPLMERANGLISFIVIVAVLGCIAIAVYPLFSEMTLPGDMHPLTLYLWMSGEKMTAQEWVDATTQAEQRKWDELIKKQPAFEFDSEGFQRGLIYQPDQNWNGGGFGQSFDSRPAWTPSR
jgi:hypothetical protein